MLQDSVCHQERMQNLQEKPLCTATSSTQKSFSFFLSFLLPSLLFLSPSLSHSLFLSLLCRLGTDINFHFLLLFPCSQEQKLPQTESPNASDSWVQTVKLPSTVRDSLCEEVSCEYLTVSCLCKKHCHSANWLEDP